MCSTKSIILICSVPWQKVYSHCCATISSFLSLGLFHQTKQILYPLNSSPVISSPSFTHEYHYFTFYIYRLNSVLDTHSGIIHLNLLCLVYFASIMSSKFILQPVSEFYSFLKPNDFHRVYIPYFIYFSFVDI